jgi:undecaprenyl-diphosphatase
MKTSSGRLLTLSAVLLALFLALTVSVVAGWSQPLDDAWFSLMAGAEVPWLVSVAKVFHQLGGFPTAFIVALAIGGVFIGMKKWWALGAWAAMVGGAEILSIVTKLMIDRPRPVDSILHEPSASYPSGHAMVSGAAIGIGLAVLAGLIWRRRSSLFLGFGIAFAFLMALSRTYLRVHWLTDVTGGLLFGTAVVCFVTAVLLRRGIDDGVTGSDATGIEIPPS